MNREDKRLNTFTYDEYKYLLAELKSRYQIKTYSDFYLIEEQKPFVVIRHDVDLDLESAANMAELEKQQGITATYCILVSSNIYNPFTVWARKEIKRIVSAGHEIALHFNIQNYSLEERFEGLEMEANLLSDLINKPIQFVCTHCPGRHGDIPDKAEGLDNVNFIRSATKYFSDSEGRWRFGHPLLSKEFANSESLHICIHPDWWDEKETTRFYKVFEAAEKQRWRFSQTINEDLIKI